MEPIIVTYRSNRYGEVLAEVRFRDGVTIAVTSDLAVALGLKVKEPDRQQSLFTWEPKP